MKNKKVKLPNGAHGKVLTDPDEHGNVVVIKNNSAKSVEIHKDRLTILQ